MARQFQQSIKHVAHIAIVILGDTMTLHDPFRGDQGCGKRLGVVLLGRPRNVLGVEPEASRHADGSDEVLALAAC